MSARASLARLSGLVKAKRREKRIGLREAADESKVSPSTLSRIERGAATSLPDSVTLTKLAVWLKMPVGSLLSDKPRKAEAPKLTTPEIVEVHLRADRELSHETAEALAEMFKSLYKHCLQTQRVPVKSKKK